MLPDKLCQQSPTTGSASLCSVAVSCMVSRTFLKLHYWFGKAGPLQSGQADPIVLKRRRVFA